MSENFPEVIQVSDLQQNTEVNFVAIKIGDVNGNAKPSSLVKAADRTTASTFEISTTDKLLKAGETYSLVFNTKQLTEIQGYQFTLGYNNLKMEKLKSGLAGVENFGLHKMDKGFITTSWNESTNLPSNNTKAKITTSTELFTIEFTALKDGPLSEQLSIIDRPTTSEAYDANGNLMDIRLTFTTPLFDNQFELFQNQPNPFHNKTMIGFYLPGYSEIQLILRDETGRVLKTIKEDRNGGYNTIQLENTELTNGFIYYQLSTKYGTQAKKMLKLN